MGHLTDETGLVYMRARYYDPACGRFISEDPARNGSNWYSYCGNNPVNAIDPTGQEGFSLSSLMINQMINSLLSTAFAMAADVMYQVLMIWTGQRDGFSTKELSLAAKAGFISGLLTPATGYTATSLYGLVYQSAIKMNGGCYAGMIAAFGAMTGQNDFIGGFMDALEI